MKMAIACGCLQTIVVTEKGSVLWWGGLVDDDSMRLVHGGIKLEPTPVGIERNYGLRADFGDPAVMASAGRGHAAIVTEAGRVLCFGVGTDGQPSLLPCSAHVHGVGARLCGMLACGAVALFGVFGVAAGLMRRFEHRPPGKWIA